MAEASSPTRQPVQRPTFAPNTGVLPTSDSGNSSVGATVAGVMVPLIVMVACCACCFRNTIKKNCCPSEQNEERDRPFIADSREEANSTMGQRLAAAFDALLGNNKQSAQNKLTSPVAEAETKRQEEGAYINNPMTA